MYEYYAQYNGKVYFAITALTVQGHPLPLLLTVMLVCRSFFRQFIQSPQTPTFIRKLFIFKIFFHSVKFKM